MDLVCSSVSRSERCHSGRLSGVLSSVGPLASSKAFFFKYSSGHYILWLRASSIVDIIISNLTHRNGNGVPNDFDYDTNPHARIFDRDNPTPFLALEFLYRDGMFKSSNNIDTTWIFFLGFFWISTCYNDNTQTTPASPYHLHWLKHNFVKCRTIKKDILTMRFIPMAKSYRPLAEAFLVFQRYWRVYFHKKAGKKSS